MISCTCGPALRELATGQVRHLAGCPAHPLASFETRIELPKFTLPKSGVLDLHVDAEGPGWKTRVLEYHPKPWRTRQLFVHVSPIGPSAFRFINTFSLAIGDGGRPVIFEQMRHILGAKTLAHEWTAASDLFVQLRLANDEVSLLGEHHAVLHLSVELLGEP